MTNKLAVILSLVLLLPVKVNALDSVGNIAGNFPCYDFMQLKEKLSKEHEELPFVSGMGVTTLLNMQEGIFEMAEHGLYLFVNPKTYEYTLMFKMDVGENGAGCIVSTGKNLGPVIQDEGI